MGLASSSVHDAFSRQDNSAFEKLQYQKRTGNYILELAKELTDQHKTYRPETKSRLNDIFTLSLERDPGRRDGNIGDLVEVLFGEESPP